MAPIYGWSNAERLPEPNMRVSLNYSDIIFYDYQAEHGTFVFWDSNSAKSLFVFTNRTINITHTCDAHRVTAGKDSISEEIQVDGVGQVYVSQKKPLSTTFFINNHTACPDGNPRCSVVEVLELSETQPWYYKCRITLDTTRNDPQNRSFVSDSMATIATSSIARGGLIDSTGQQAQLLPQSGFWGQPLGGDNATMGRTISMFSLASIAGAALYNPWNYYPGMTPIEGQVLKSRFLGINSMSLGFLFSVHLFFYVYAVLEAKKVQIGPTSPLEMNMMLRPVTVALSDMSYDSDNKALRNRMKHTMVRYERARNDGKWKINVIQDEEYHSLPQAWAGRPILSADSRLRMANDGSSAVSWVSRESF
jgi:hypothetical protein